MPLTGAAALRAEQPWEPREWMPAFLKTFTTEAEDGLDLLYTLERPWFEARHSVARRRKNSRAGMAVDVLAAAPVLSATSLAGIFGIAVKNALRILDELVAAEIAIEVTRRSKGRLFGLKGLAPLRDVVRPPYRPDLERGRGRPRLETEDDPSEGVALSPLPPLERRAFDYTAFEEAMAPLDAVVRRTRHVLTRRGSDLSPASKARPIENAIQNNEITLTGPMSCTLYAEEPNLSGDQQPRQSRLKERNLMSANERGRGTIRKAMAMAYVLPKRRSANAIFVPLWTILAILGASWEQPNNKRIIAALLAIGAVAAAMTLASQHLRFAGRKTTHAKVLGITLIVTLGCCWAPQYWLAAAALSVVAKIIAFGGMAASLALCITISIMGLRVVKPSAVPKRRDRGVLTDGAVPARHIDRVHR